MRARLRDAGAVIAAVLLVTGCGGGSGSTGVPNAPQANVHVRQDPDVDFSDYRTYDWVDRATLGESEDTGLDEQMDAQIVTAVDSVLNAKGYERVSANPDFKVVWYGTFTGHVEEHEAKQRHPSYFQRENSVAFTSTQQVTTHWEDGTFIVDVLDAQTDSLIWSVHAEGSIQTSGNPEVMQQRFYDGAGRVLRDFPSR